MSSAHLISEEEAQSTSTKNTVTQNYYPARHNGKGIAAKSVEEWAQEYHFDLCSRVVRLSENKGDERVLVCRYCCITIASRHDRIKEHLITKRHAKLKASSFELQDRNGQITKVHCIPEPHIDQVKLSTTLRRQKGYAVQNQSKVNTNADDNAKTKSPEGSGRVNFSYSSVNWMGQSPNQCQADLSPVRPVSILKDPVVTQPQPERNALEVEPMLLKEEQQPINPQSINGQDSEETIPKGQVGQEQEKKLEGKIVHISWNEYPAIIGKFMNQEVLKDVTISCDGGLIIKFHKLVLSFCSEYFENLFKAHATSSPVIILLKDTFIWEMEAIRDFMYLGRMILYDWQIKTVLKTAEALRIKGLASYPTALNTCRIAHVAPRINNTNSAQENSRNTQIEPKSNPEIPQENAETAEGTKESEKVQMKRGYPVEFLTNNANDEVTMISRRGSVIDFAVSQLFPQASSSPTQPISIGTGSGGGERVETGSKRPRLIAPKRANMTDESVLGLNQLFNGPQGITYGENKNTSFEPNQNPDPSSTEILKRFIKSRSVVFQSKTEQSLSK